MILVDANILLYAEDKLNPQHEIARSWWDAQLSGGAPVCLAWSVVARESFRNPGVAASLGILDQATLGGGA